MNTEKQNPVPILSIRNLHVSIGTGEHSRPVLKGASLDVPKGRTIALVGESGSGKTLTAYAILRLLPSMATIREGCIYFNGQNILVLKPSQLRRIRGNQIGMIYQEPTTALNPLMPVGKQISETLINHNGITARNAREQVLALMDLAGIPDANRRFNQYPHQLSGGVKQRVLIAMALACRPELLLADEPTSALDTTVQAQILDLLSRLIQDLRMSVLLISHDMNVVTALADEMAVLYGGMVIEQGPVREVRAEPAHPYTRALLSEQSNPSRSMDIAASVSLPGCPFAPLCPWKMEICTDNVPSARPVTRERMVRCHLLGGSEDVAD